MNQKFLDLVTYLEIASINLQVIFPSLCLRFFFLLQLPLYISLYLRSLRSVPYPIPIDSPKISLSLSLFQFLAFSRRGHLTHVRAKRAAREGPITCSRTCNKPPCSIYPWRGNVGKAADHGTGVRVCASCVAHRQDHNGLSRARAHVFIIRPRLIPGYRVGLPLPVTAGRPEFRGPLPDAPAPVRSRFQPGISVVRSVQLAAHHTRAELVRPAPSRVSLREVEAV